MSEIKLPLLDFLFSSELRKAIMYDALCDGQDEISANVTLVEEEDFQLQCLNVYQFNWCGDGSWMGVALGDAEPTEDKVLDAPTITIPSDDLPQLHTTEDLLDKIEEGLEAFLKDQEEMQSYTEDFPAEEVAAETQKMIDELKLIEDYSYSSSED